MNDRHRVSKGEQEFALHCLANDLSPEREFRFHPKRRWRFDFAFPEFLLAVEIEGGIWTRGRHNRPTGFSGDCEKYNAAALLGWMVLRYPTDQVINGSAINDVLEFLRKTRCKGRNQP